MKHDISRLPFREWKHTLGVFLQMGRVQLDSDWNEQSELTLRLLQRHAEDTVRIGSPNLGFHIDDRILLDTMDVRAAWRIVSANGDVPAPKPSVDSFDFRTGKGSLVVEGATTLVRTLSAPVDCREWNEVVFAAKGAFSATEGVFFLSDGRTQELLVTTADASADPTDWMIFRARRSAAAPAIDLSQVTQYGFTSLNPANQYKIDSIKIDNPIRQTLVPMTSLHGFDAESGPTGAAQLRLNDGDRFWRDLVLDVSNATAVTHTVAVPRDLSHARKLLVAVQTTATDAPAITVSDATAGASHVTLSDASETTVGSWKVLAFDLPQGGIDWREVKSIRWSDLDAEVTYHIAAVQFEMDLRGNLVIMGGDGTSDGAGRFYGDGLAAIKESHETYFSQRDLPLADPSAFAAPAEGKCRSDLAYLDLWERPITYIEDPDIREVALEGFDTCTRMQLMAQVRFLKGAETDIGTTPNAPLEEFTRLLPKGRGVLSTKDKPDVPLDPCADPCEPEIAGTFLGEENRLFRVEIHRFGQVGATNPDSGAVFKWSRENAAVATMLTADAEAGVFTVKVEKPELFAEGDLIEISNDLVDLVTGSYENRDDRRSHQRGELRKITAINKSNHLISWEDATSAERQFHAPLEHPQNVAWHAHVRRWDGVQPVTAGDITLADGVVIEFGGSDLLPGDFWCFATRVADRSVERLIEAPPRGILHRHFPLAHVERSRRAGESEIVKVIDLRPQFDPLPELKAAGVAYDPGPDNKLFPGWDKVQNVQQAIDALSRVDIDFDLRDHNKHLHGSGVVCGLQVNCNANRSMVAVRPGYALDCEGHVLRLKSETIFPVIDKAAEIGAIDSTGKGEVALTIDRDLTIKVEKVPEQSYWDSILEGTLLRDFYEKTIKPAYQFLQDAFWPLGTTAPVPETNKRAISILNLAGQVMMPATGRYVFISKREDELLRKFYHGLKDKLASRTFCAMFDDLAPFPAYPFSNETAIDTAFGLFQSHTRLRLHPGNHLAYTCGGGNKIHVFDLERKELTQSLEFPGGSSVQLQDVALSPDGTKLHAVGLLNNQDSIFATADIDPGTNAHRWGPTTVVCDILFVTLGTTRRHPANLYAIGRSRGLYILSASSIDLEPRVDVGFNATGMMEIDPDTDFAVAADAGGTSLGTVSAEFNRCVRINLANPSAGPTNFNSELKGVDSENDITFSRGGTVLIASTAADIKNIKRFQLSSGQVVGAVSLGKHLNTAITRLAVAGDNQLLVTIADQHRVIRIDLNAASLSVSGNFRIPVQFVPFDIATNTMRDEIYALNMLSNTLSIVQASSVLGASPPSYTIEPPSVLSDYREKMLTAFIELFGKYQQYLKDGFCDQFLVDCPDCKPEHDKVYLGCVEIRDRKVFKICNFSKRRYVKSVQLVEYWLSSTPIIPMLKKAFADFCCKVL